MTSAVKQEVPADAAAPSATTQSISKAQGGNDATTVPTASLPANPQTHTSQDTSSSKSQPKRPLDASSNAAEDPPKPPKQSKSKRQKAKRNGMCFTCNSADHKWYKCMAKCQWCQQVTHPCNVCPRKGVAWYEKSGNHKLSGKQRVRAKEGKVLLANGDALKELREKCEALSAEVQGLKRQLAEKK
ncbi:hypothetical protein BDY17DRAFT_327958 [Neohortaea acidophila]|uniref:Uncharacterized protein n=1 Tax=Neohortaea acidophila TaxID=245834 RepID=A0A6A6PHB9_9PEZI|nr:uncharacterized protein BDY17DRAFT_327958 [Neohortaea acidophila]KAF2479176.1 hypothetical protein BDY17DRAFT_327958 [Neohortaea acidophila]